MTTTSQPGPTGDSVVNWSQNPAHRLWLLKQAEQLMDFFEPVCVDPGGGFRQLDIQGRPKASTKRTVVQTGRMVHCFSLMHLLGRPSAARYVEHGLRSLEDMFLDRENGGFFWSVGGENPENSSKQAYGHAFVLLGASTAKIAGFPRADLLLAQVDDVLERHFWEPDQDRYRDRFTADWAEEEPYRSGNSNMHLVEALAAAYEATDEPRFLQRANVVAERLIDGSARSADWWPVEHFNARWEPLDDYNIDTPQHTYRPYGRVVGHAAEWARLLLLLRGLNNDASWYEEAAGNLFQSVTRVWDIAEGRFPYTVTPDERIVDDNQYQWALSEAIGAAAALAKTSRAPQYEVSYRRLWAFVDAHVRDREHGGWYSALDRDSVPTEIPGVVEGKSDLYHALQSCLAPLFPPGAGLGQALKQVALGSQKLLEG